MLSIRYKENLTYTETSDEEILPTKFKKKQKKTQMPSKGSQMHIWHPY